MLCQVILSQPSYLTDMVRFFIMWDVVCVFGVSHHHKTWSRVSIAVALDVTGVCVSSVVLVFVYDMRVVFSKVSLAVTSNPTKKWCIYPVHHSQSYKQRMAKGVG